MILDYHGLSFIGSILLVALFSCNECAKAIIQSGIKEVIYLSDKYSDTDSTKASKRMLEAAGIRLTQFSPDKDSITLSFK